MSNHQWALQSAVDEAVASTVDERFFGALRDISAGLDHCMQFNIPVSEEDQKALQELAAGLKKLFFRTPKAPKRFKKLRASIASKRIKKLRSAESKRLKK